MAPAKKRKSAVGGDGGGRSLPNQFLDASTGNKRKSVRTPLEQLSVVSFSPQTSDYAGNNYTVFEIATGKLGLRFLKNPIHLQLATQIKNPLYKKTEAAAKAIWTEVKAADLAREWDWLDTKAMRQPSATGEHPPSRRLYLNPLGGDISPFIAEVSQPAATLRAHSTLNNESFRSKSTWMAPPCTATGPAGRLPTPR